MEEKSVENNAAPELVLPKLGRIERILKDLKDHNDYVKKLHASDKGATYAKSYDEMKDEFAIAILEAALGDNPKPVVNGRIFDLAEGEQSNV